MATQKKHAGWKPVWQVLTKEQRLVLLNHLCGVMTDGSAHLMVERIDDACARYLDFVSPGPVVDYMELIKSVQHVLESLRNPATDGMHRPDRGQLERYLVDLTKQQRFNYPQKRGRGRPRKEYRAELIQVLYSCYPRGKAKKSVGSHFEKTVEKVFDILEISPADLHKAVWKALPKRNDSSVATLSMEEELERTTGSILKKKGKI